GDEVKGRRVRVGVVLATATLLGAVACGVAAFLVLHDPARHPAAAGGSPPNAPITGRAAGRREPNSLRCVLAITATPSRTMVGLGPLQWEAARQPDILEWALAHEIVRQAVLVAARDALGAGVRDATIGEDLPEGSPQPAWEIHTRFPRDGSPASVTVV